MAKLTVHRKAYRRKDGTRVKASTYKINDRGAKGRGKKVLPTLKKGSLGGKGFFSKPAIVRHSTYKKECKLLGKKSLLGKIQALKVFNKRDNKPFYDKLCKDYEWIVKNC